MADGDGKEKVGTNNATNLEEYDGDPDYVIILCQKMEDVVGMKKMVNISSNNTVRTSKCSVAESYNIQLPCWWPTQYIFLDIISREMVRKQCCCYLILKIMPLYCTNKQLNFFTDSCETFSWIQEARKTFVAASFNLNNKIGFDQNSRKDHYKNAGKMWR